MRTRRIFKAEFGQLVDFIRKTFKEIRNISALWNFPIYESINCEDTTLGELIDEIGIRTEIRFTCEDWVATDGRETHWIAFSSFDDERQYEFEYFGDEIFSTTDEEYIDDED